MLFSLHRWRPRHLVAAWVTYWAGLAAIGLRSAIVAAWHVTHLPDGHGNITAGFDSAVLRLTITEDARVVWAGSIHFATLALWIVAPPLLLFVLWLVRRPSRADGRGRELDAARVDAIGGDAPAELDAGELPHLAVQRGPKEPVASTRRRAD